jgi:hypothetical protein
MKVKHTKNGNVKATMPLDTAVVLRGILLDTYKPEVRTALNLSVFEAQVLWELEDELDEAGIQTPWNLD